MTVDVGQSTVRTYTGRAASSSFKLIVPRDDETPGVDMNAITAGLTKRHSTRTKTGEVVLSTIAGPIMGRWFDFEVNAQRVHQEVYVIGRNATRAVLFMQDVVLDGHAPGTAFMTLRGLISASLDVNVTPAKPVH